MIHEARRTRRGAACTRDLDVYEGKLHPDRCRFGTSHAPAAPGARENGGREATAKVGAAVARVDRAALIVLLRK